MRPTFVLSLDEELVWGSFDHTSDAHFARRNPDLRGVVRDLLALFDRYEIATTWAVVGHLFLENCARGADGRAHPELVRPHFAWYRGDWFDRDPCTDERRAPLWYGSTLIDAIQNARTCHEIGSHSFSHLLYGDPGCSQEAAAHDLRACRDVAARRGIELTSFVFPRNLEGHHALLRETGFSAYRGMDPVWFAQLPARAQRAAHFADQALAFCPPVSLPSETLPGLWNIPGSMIFWPRGGARSLVPVATRVHKAKLGLQAALRSERVFHLWFHPFNFSIDRGAMFDGLEQVLREVSRLRDAGQMEVRTMAEVAAQAAGASASLAPPLR